MTSVKVDGTMGLCSGDLGLRELPATDLEFGKYYVVRFVDYDDDGTEVSALDMGLCAPAVSKGKDGQPHRMLKMTGIQKALMMSQMVGARFFGPMTFTLEEV